MPTLIREDSHPQAGGECKLFACLNGYGASVVRHAYSYGGTQGYWELAVVRFRLDVPEGYGLVYDTPVTGEVIGWMTDGDVQEALDRIEDLPAVEGAPSLQELQAFFAKPPKEERKPFTPLQYQALARIRAS